MDFIFNFFPGLPWDMPTIAMHMIAMAGATFHIYGVFLEKEKRRDIVFVLSGLCLFFYALWIKNDIFMLASGGFAVASFIELIEIMTGIHKHSQKEISDYKK
jgi:hypothetical protein